MKKKLLKETAISIKDLPAKRNVNLIGVEKKKFNFKVAIPLIVAIVVILAVASKFLIIDRYIELYEAQSEIAELQVEKTLAYSRLNSFGDLVETYAHYTYSDFTYEELYRADRVKVLELIEEKVDKKNLLSFNLVENQCVIQINNITLGMAKDIASDLKTSELVDFCIVTNANTGDEVHYISDNQIVTAQITIYLNERGYE